jgi:nitrile hydratase
MNSINDIGGMDGFGPVRAQSNEPAFHEPWEGRVWAMTMSGSGTGSQTFDAARHQWESIEPIQYLQSSYYERLLLAYERLLIRAGTLSKAEVEAKALEFATDPKLPTPRHEDPAFAERIAGLFRAGSPVTRSIQKKPRFAIGDHVFTQNLNPRGHTRLPRYARAKKGVIVSHHGAHVFPDTNAHGLGENPQHLYTVRISARELWGDSAEPNESMFVDMWESYLGPDRRTGRRSFDAKQPENSKKVTSRASKPKPRVRLLKRLRRRGKPTQRKSR